MQYIKINKEKYHWSEACRALLMFDTPYRWMSSIYRNDPDDILYTANDKGYDVNNILIVDFDKQYHASLTDSTYYEYMIVENIDKKQFMSILNRYKKLRVFS